MRFLLLEGVIAGSSSLNLFDTGNLILGNGPADLAEVLDFIERHPESSLRSSVPFWEFVTSEILPPEREIIEHEKREDPGARFLEVYELDAHEPLWDERQMSDAVAVETFRCVSSLYAFVPLRRCSPALRIVSG